MISNLKTLGSMLVAMFAICALATSASAQTGQLTAEAFPVHLEGFQTLGPANRYTAFGMSLECPEGNGYADVEKPSGTITAIPRNPGGCKVGSFKATVTTNGCDTLLHIGKTTGVKDQYSGTSDLVCPAGKNIELHIYLSSSNENVQTCKIVIKAQNGLTGGTVTNDTVTHGLILSGAVEGITAEKSGVCGTASTNEAVFEGEATVTGTNEAKAPDGIQISDE